MLYLQELNSRQRHPSYTQSGGGCQPPLARTFGPSALISSTLSVSCNSNIVVKIDPESKLIISPGCESEQLSSGNT